RKKRAIIPAVCKAALLAGWQADAVLKIVLADPSKVKSGQLDLPEFSRRARLLYRTSTGRW
ncbi:MAG: phytoene synthase, partial [Paracoccaceae bacterium]